MTCQAPRCCRSPTTSALYSLASSLARPVAGESTSGVSSTHSAAPGPVTRFDQLRHRALPGCRAFNGHGPGLALAIVTATADLAADGHQIIMDTNALGQFGQAVNAVTLGDGRQVDIEISAVLLQCRRFVAAVQAPVADPGACCCQGCVAGCLIAARLRTKTPQVDQRSDRDIKSAIAEHAQAQRFIDQLLQLR